MLPGAERDGSKGPQRSKCLLVTLSLFSTIFFLIYAGAFGDYVRNRQSEFVLRENVANILYLIFGTLTLLISYFGACYSNRCLDMMVFFFGLIAIASGGGAMQFSGKYISDFTDCQGTSTQRDCTDLQLQCAGAVLSAFFLAMMLLVFLSDQGLMNASSGDRNNVDAPGRAPVYNNSSSTPTPGRQSYNRF